MLAVQAEHLSLMTTSKDIDANIRALCDVKGWTFRPWELHPAEVDEGPNPYPRQSAGATSWRKAQALRRELIKELGEERGVAPRDGEESDGK